MSPSIHRHPVSGKIVIGDRLVPGDVIRVDDVYDSTSGGWEFSPCAGATIEEGNETYWVRPIKSQIVALKAEEERRLIGLARKRKMSAQEDRAQRVSFAYGNAAGNPLITRKMVEEEVCRLEKKRKK